MVAFVSAGVGLGHKDSVSTTGDGRERRIWLLWPLGGLGNKDCDCYRGRLRTTRVLWRLQGLAENDQGGFCGLATEVGL